MAPRLLVADIGGTNARFALADSERGAFSNELTFEREDYASTDLVIDAYLETCAAARPEAVCIAAAGPVIDGNIQLTNAPWRVDRAMLESKFPGARICLLNDFDAVAFAIPLLGKSDCISIGDASPVELNKDDYTIAVIGPGTGLGTAGLCKKNGHIFAIGGEGGHVGFAPETELQRELLADLSKAFERVSVESLVSGPGIGNIYGSLARIRGQKAAQPVAAEIFELATSGKDEIAVDAVRVFFEVLGQAAGDLALSFGAIDGIYIAGGIVMRYPGLILDSPFREGFESKGPYRSMMKNTPTQLIIHPQPGLLGASFIAMQAIAGE